MNPANSRAWRQVEGSPCVRVNSCRWWTLGLLWSWAILVSFSAGAAEGYVKGATWVETVLSSRAALADAGLSEPERAAAAEEAWMQFHEDYPVQWDWVMQDCGSNPFGWGQSAAGTTLEQGMIRHVAEELGESGRGFSRQAEGLLKAKAPRNDRRWLDLYEKACEQRRGQRLRTVLARTPRIVFVKHHTVRPSFYAYTEGQSDAQNERHFLPDSELCLLEMSGLYGKVRSLVSDPTGAIRDPAVSWDGQRVAFAWKKSLDEDDYHLYVLDVASNQVRQVTAGLGFTDYEPAWLPNGDLVFASTRCVQTVDCWWTEVSNLYTCDPDGRYLRRLGFDQVHSIYPQVLEDGRVIYTRWDYNDRGQIFPQGLFQMYPDGTGQTAFYGNNSWFPTTIAHARGIPGTQKVLAILCGHHTSQAGKLAVIDPGKGRQENHGVQLVAPIRDTPAERIDGYGQDGELWQYPWPLNERECLVTYAPLGWDRPRRRGDAHFGIYWMDLDGKRELLASDLRLPCCQPVPLATRPAAFMWANRVDYAQTIGTYYVQDIYAGPGLAGIARGTVKKLRVVALDFRAAGVGNNENSGVGGGALVSTPIAIGNGAWDVKTVLGEAPVYADGSALFTVPARVPVYFQALDERGCAVQTMRSWSTLQPGEYFACVGCHDHPNAAPPTENYGYSEAMKAGAKPLEPFYGPTRGFSFSREIQPVLDQHCIRCHKDRAPVQRLARGETRRPLLGKTRSARAAGDGARDEVAFSLLGEVAVVDRTAARKWSDAYLALTGATPRSAAIQDGSGLAGVPAVEGPFQADCQGRVVHWLSPQSAPEPLPPYSAGAARSELVKLLESGHQGVRLSREELDKITCWIDLLVPYCGDYLEANAWSQTELRKYQHFATKRLRSEEIEQDSIHDLLEGKEPRRRGSGGSMGPGRMR